MPKVGTFTSNDRKAPTDLKRFLNQQNIERYSKLLDIASDETQRRQIQNLLAEEQDKARELQQAEPSLRAAEHDGFYAD
jgi:rubrerythrin